LAKNLREEEIRVIKELFTHSLLIRQLVGRVGLSCAGFAVVKVVMTL
jgi:predicted thioredoxin/glutaredoxin